MGTEYKISKPIGGVIKKEYIVPKETPLGIGLSRLRKAGEIAAIAAADARNNQRSPNPYIRGISSANTTTPDAGLGNTSDLKTKVYADVTFDSVTYTDSNNNPITTPKMTFQAILVSVVFPRNIIKTEIQGRDGTVKEYIGEGDASLSFTGIMVGGNGVYPSELIASFMKVIKAPVAIPVISTHLQNMGIYAVVFDDRTFDQTEGSYSYQTFSVNAISDTPQELSISGM